MRALFIGILPPKPFLKALSAQGLTAVSRKALRSGLGPFDLVVVEISRIADIPLLDRVRHDYRGAALAAVVSDTVLHTKEGQRRLLSNASKDAIWARRDWQSLFWFELQRLCAQKQLTAELSKAQADRMRFQRQVDEFSIASTTLLKRFEKDLSLAENIQRSLLPKSSPVLPGISFSVKYLPASGLGGDYYDLFEFGDKRRFGILLADSKSHGMAAALLSVLLKLRLEEMKDRFPDSHTFVAFLNREIKEISPKNPQPLSLLYGIVDRNSLTFRYTSAGALTPFLWRKTRRVRLPLSEHPPLGVSDEDMFQQREIQLEPGDLLILHTDGLEAVLGESPLAHDRLTECLRLLSQPIPIASQNEVMALIDQAIEKAPLPDDLTLIHIGIDPHALYVTGGQSPLQVGK